MSRQDPSSDLPVNHLLGFGEQSTRKSYHRELTARMEELEVERNRYKWLFENALHGIFQASFQGELHAANPALAKMLGYPSIQVMLENCQYFDDLFVDLLTARDVQKRLSSRDAFKCDLLWLKAASGRQVPVAMTLIRKPSEFADQDNLIEGFVADVTQREQARRHLEALNMHLETRVASRTRELEQLNQALEKARDEAVVAKRSKDRYLTAASHDLLQPMNAARLMIDSLQDRLDGSENRAIVSNIQSSLAGAEAILSDLLDIARLEHDQVQPHIRHFCVAEVLDDLVNEFRACAEEKGLALKYVPSRLGVSSDPHLLGRIIRNFLANACRYTQQGGICLGVRRRGSESVVIEVWDTGSGIPQHEFQRIFQEFQQLNARQAGQGQGVGLGLAIVERISQHLQHPLGVRSRPGRGSCFSVRLPLAEMTFDKPSKIEKPTHTHEFEGLLALVIDNEPSILSGMALVLENWGIKCETASDLDSALMSQTMPDMLLVDLHLDNQVTGVDVIHQLRQHWKNPHLPAVIISADRSPEWQHRLNQARIPLLHKPVRPARLRALLQSVMET